MYLTNAAKSESTNTSPSTPLHGAAMCHCLSLLTVCAIAAFFPCCSKDLSVAVPRNNVTT